jgi:phosphoenolpyruvate---glycerone phosphotransferase subunit DhaM
MPDIELEVINPSGLHARPAALFTETAAGFQSRITVENLDRGAKPVDAKSILFVLTIGVLRGNRIRVTAEGPDAEMALDAISALVTGGLGEPGGA